MQLIITWQQALYYRHLFVTRTERQTQRKANVRGNISAFDNQLINQNLNDHCINMDMSE